MDDSKITCDQIIESYEIKHKQFQQIAIKIATCKTKKVYILVAFISITIALLIAVSLLCYLIKH